MNAAQPFRTLADIEADIAALLSACPDPETLVCAVSEVPKYWRIIDEIDQEISVLRTERRSRMNGVSCFADLK